MMTEGAEAKADDSDYYTPEDPHTNILSPVKSERTVEKVKCFIDNLGQATNSSRVIRRTLRHRYQLLRTLNFQIAPFQGTRRFLREALAAKATVPVHRPGNFYLRFPLTQVK